MVTVGGLLAWIVVTSREVNNQAGLTAWLTCLINKQAIKSIHSCSMLVLNQSSDIGLLGLLNVLGKLYGGGVLVL
jgi:hypothetical protein